MELPDKGGINPTLGLQARTVCVYCHGRWVGDKIATDLPRIGKWHRHRGSKQILIAQVHGREK
jgi:cytochrome c553